MSKQVAIGVIVAVVTALGGCAGVGGRQQHPAVAWPPPEGEPRKLVWLVRHGFHTRVAVRRADVDPRLWPESRHFGDVAYLEVGWGDRDFYPKPDPSIWDAIDAVIRPTPAALHAGGFDPAPPRFLPDQAIVRIPVTERGFDELTRFLHRHYATDAGGQPIRIRPGYYERSWFYDATGRYHAFHNSNTWAAEALHAAGVPTNPVMAITAGCVMAQARKFGVSVGRKDRR